MIWNQSSVSETITISDTQSGWLWDYKNFWSSFKKKLTILLQTNISIFLKTLLKKKILNQCQEKSVGPTNKKKGVLFSERTWCLKKSLLQNEVLVYYVVVCSNKLFESLIITLVSQNYPVLGNLQPLPSSYRLWWKVSVTKTVPEVSELQCFSLVFDLISHLLVFSLDLGKKSFSIQLFHWWVLTDVLRVQRWFFLFCVLLKLCEVCLLWRCQFYELQMRAFKQANLVWFETSRK